MKRNTFEIRENHSGVFKQQGRVQLDTDWSEQAGIDRQRMRVALRDVIGRCGAPRDAAGFAVSVARSALVIGAGRYYVDGLLVENETDLLAYDCQPDLPDPPSWTDALARAASSFGLVYLDVWKRHVTAFDDASLTDVALDGPDATTRVKIVWQVRVLPLVKGCDPPGLAGRASCRTDFPEWDAVVANPERRLNARIQTSTEADASGGLVTPGGYRGLENQLYRVEVHTPGEGAGKGATFKWSRDNGSRVAAVKQVSGKEVTLRATSPKNVLGFEPGHWIEISDDALELAGRPGPLVQIESVDALRSMLSLVMTPASFWVGSSGVDPERHPKIRRWDQAFELPDAADGLAIGSDWLELEDGIEVQFSEGTYRTGDYWLIPARTATGDIEWPPFKTANATPEPQLPLGIEHHYCRLALIALDANAEGWSVVEDCRPIFSPLVGGGTDD